MTRYILLALLLAPLAAAAQSIYRTTDEHGNVIFTDAPGTNTEQSERVELQSTNTAPPPPQRPEPVTPPAAEEEAIAYTVQITDPIDQTSMPMGPGNFTVSARVEPEPGEDDSLQLFIDGIPWGDPQSATTWNLTNIFRGQHDLTVAVITGNGTTLVSSDPIRVFVHRPSINFRARQ